jgi:hypothetical protein
VATASAELRWMRVPFTPAASSRFGLSAGLGPDFAGLNDLGVRRLLGLETN